MHQLLSKLIAASLLLSAMHFGVLVAPAEESTAKANKEAATQAKPAIPAEHLEFFEAKVRPLLVEHCYACHSSQSDEVKAGLRLDARSFAIEGGDSGAAIVPGKPEESLLIEAVHYESVEMPPKDKLTDAQIAVLEKWIQLGAPWPATEVHPAPAPTTAEGTYAWDRLRQEHWAFRPVVAAAPPAVKDAVWPTSDIDRFVLARLETAGVTPSERASREVLVRRVYFDLLGLPPTPAEVDAFASDERPDAFAQLVDQLLESPHYGERWGRHWLDVARYSDGQGGFLDQRALPHAWRYRDWVIDALNRDMPYNEFLRMQIAGDLVDNREDTDATSGVVATGFFAVGPTYKADGKDQKAMMQASADTLDDRVDTLTRGVLGLTVSCARCHDHKFDPIPQLDYYSLAGVFNNTRVRDTRIGRRESLERFAAAEKVVRAKEVVRKRLDQSVRKDGRRPTLDEQQELARLQKEINQLKKKLPPYPAAVHALVETGSRDMQLAIRGNVQRLGPLAPRRFLRIVDGKEPARFESGSGRLELAERITSDDNPLTARVMVNRVWMHHFGKALVRTPSNFGILGEAPTHPELLDWLTDRFISQGWSLKKLHRDILLTATYQMNSQFDAAKFAIDGDNRLLWRMNPRRMDVESWRDALFAVTGQLDRKLGGRPLDDINRPRRTIYMKASRNGDQVKPDEFLRLFDYPSSRATVAKRTPNVVPQQYLFMMNNGFMAARAKDLVSRLKSEGAADDAALIASAYRLLYGRAATQAEIELGLGYLAGDNKDETRWQQYAQVLLSANEFMHVE